MRPKLNSTVSVVKLNDQILEFFKTNTRQQVRIKVQDDAILQLVTSLDGEKEIDQIAKEQNIDPSELKVLLDFLQGKGILDNVEPKSDFFHYEKYRRVIHFLSEYSVSHEHLLEMWKNINSATVMIIGLGAVGTWVACNLAETGVGRLMSMSLSGGEAQRIKLAKSLSVKSRGNGLYILDEPTSGLNDVDIQKVEYILNRLSKNGETILIIEHNLEFIARIADYLVDLGCVAGDNGGKTVIAGDPKKVISSPKSSWYFINKMIPNDN